MSSAENSIRTVLGCIMALAVGNGVALAQTTTKPPPTKVTIMVGISVGAPQVSVYWVGKPLGFFAEENIDARVEVAPNSNMAQGAQLVIGGQADAVLTSIESVLLPFTQNKDTGLTFVYNFYTKPQYRIAVRENSNISSVADLKGKLLGLSHSGNPVEPMLTSYLSDSGVSRDAIRSQVVGNAMPAAEALKGGQIDATMQVAMNFANWREVGYNFKLLPEPKEFSKLIGAAVGVRRSALVDPERRSAIVRFLRAWAKSQLFVRENPQAAVELNFKQFPQARPRNVTDADALRSGMNAQAAVMDVYTTKVGGKWGAFPTTVFNDYVRFLGLPENIPDLGSLWSNDLIAEINNFDENVVIEKARNYKSADYK